MLTNRFTTLLSVLLFVCAVPLSLKSVLAAPSAPHQVVINRLYVFGDSYSDIGEGYLDGNGPTSVAYLARQLGFQLLPSNDPAAGKSLDFAISGAQSGSGAGHRIGKALLSFGMRNQVDEFADRVHSRNIDFDPKTTLFFFAGGLNDRNLPTETTVSNLEGEIKTIYALGGRHFMVALLPTSIPDFTSVSTRLNPALAKIPAELTSQLPGAHVNLSHWGPFYDDVMSNPAKYGITNTTDQCAGRAIFHQDSTPCASPSTHFYYHHGHPSTATHKIVGGMLYNEVLALEKQGQL